MRDQVSLLTAALLEIKFLSCEKSYANEQAGPVSLAGIPPVPGLGKTHCVLFKARDKIHPDSVVFPGTENGQPERIFS